MKQAIIGLRKRETYDELINDLNHDLITNYPDRRASEQENSSYMSQLRGGFEEMLIQNDNLLKEKQKEILLHEEASEANIGRHEQAIKADRTQRNPPAPQTPAPQTPAPQIPQNSPHKYFSPALATVSPAFAQAMQKDLDDFNARKTAPENSPYKYVSHAFATANPAFAEALQKDLDAQRTLRYPVGQPVAYTPDRPEIQVSETRSRSSRKATNRNQPIIDPVIQEA